MRIGHQHASTRRMIAGFLLVVAILFGGGGSPAPIAEFVVQLAALAALITWVWFAQSDRCYPRAEVDWPLFVLVGLFVAIPVIQLIPLPPSIWHQFPGRAVERQALALVGAEDVWMPLSASPTRTLVSLLSLIPPLVMLYFVTQLTKRDRSKLLGLLGMLALVSVVVGTVQLVSGNANWFRFYEGNNRVFATGFQASRNAQADVLIIASMALTAWAVSSRRIANSRQACFIVLVLVIVMWLAVIVTGSRSGVVLIPIALLTCLLMLAGHMRLPGKRIAIVSLAALLILGVGTGIALRNNVRVERTFARFDDLEDVRPEIWADTWYAIGQHWPAGTGLGTFRPVFDAAERLEFLRPTYANRAHNDYLEYLLEAGIAGALLLIAVILFAVHRIVGMFRRNDDRRVRAQLLFVAGSLVALILHSAVDYPMRTMSLAIITGLMAGLLSRERTSKSRVSGGVEG